MSALPPASNDLSRPPRRWGRRLSRAAVISGLSLLAMLLGMLAVVLIGLATPQGTRWVVARGLAELPELRVGAVDGSLLEELRLSAVEVQDQQGVWLRIDHLAVSWQPLRLLTGALYIDQVTAGDVQLERAPLGAPAPEAAKPPEPAAVPVLPNELLVWLRHLSLRDVAVERLQLGPSFIGEPAQLSLKGWAQSSPFGAWQLHLDGRRLDGDTTVLADVTLHPGGVLDVQTALHESQGGLIGRLAGLPGQPALAFSLAGKGPLKAWHGTLSASAEGLLGLEGTISLAQDQDDKTPVVTLRSTLTPGAALDPAVQSMLAGTVEVSVHDLGEQPQISLQMQTEHGPVQRLSGLLALDLRDEIAATLTASAGGFTPALADHVELKASVQMTAAGAIRGQGQITATNPHLGSAAADAVFGNRLTLETKAEINGAEVRLSDLLGQSAGGLEVRGDLVLSAQQALSGGLTVALSDLKPVLSALGQSGEGSLSLPLQLGGTLAAPEVNGVLAGDGLRVADIPISTLTLPLRASLTQASIDSGEIAAAGLAASLGLSADLSTSPPRLSGKVQATLQKGQENAVREATGVMVRASSLEATLNLSSERSARAEVLVNGSGVRVSSPAGELASVDRLALKGSFGDLLGTPEGKAILELTGLTHGAQSLRSVTAQASLAASGAISVELNAKEGRDSGLVARALLNWPGTAQAPLTIHSLDLRAAGHRITSTAPWTVALPGMGVSEGWAIRGAIFAIDRGRAKLDARLAQGVLAMTFDANGLPLEAVGSVVPAFPLQGSVSAHLAAQGPVRSNGVQGQWSLTVSDIAAAEAGIRGVQVSVTGAISKQGLSAQGAVNGLGGAPVALQAQVPLIFSAQGVPTIPPTKPLHAALTWSGDVAKVWALVPVDGHRLAGDADVDLQVEGTLAAPRLIGHANLDKGRYENRDWGTVLTALTLRASVDPQGAVVVALSGSDGEDGVLKGSATITPPAGDVGPQVTAEVSADKATLVRRDDVRAAVDAKLSYRGSLTVGTLAGDITTRGVEVKLNNRLGGGVQTLTVREVNRAAANLPPLPSEDKASAPQTLTLALTLTAPGQVFVRGNGLESEWKGALQVKGSANAPEVHGMISVVRGSLDVIGKTFEITKGEIALQGGEKIDPALNIVASTTSNDVTASLVVGGYASRPTLGLESTPALPQDEILSRVLFGQKVGQLSPGQAISLAQAAASLSSFGSSDSGASGGFLSKALDVGGLIRSTLGVDVVSFNGGNSSGSESGSSATSGSVEVGKYVAEGVYVGLEQGASPGSSGVKVEVQLTPRVSVETKASGASGADVGVNYKFDY